MASDDKMNQKGQVDTTGDAVGATVGGVSGVATGAALGSLGGPIGTIIGGLAGAVGGWWAGRTVSEAASTLTSDDDQHYRSQYESAGGGNATSAKPYDRARPAYQLGHLAGMNPDYKGRSFEEVEPHLQQAYTTAGQDDWADVRAHARDAYARGRDAGEQRLTLAEEELHVGKRQVQAGEVNLRKMVETEHVAQAVSLMHEEVTIERRPVTDPNASTEIQISEDEIRIPIMAEEAVVEKRVVGVEEVVVRKETKTENQTVEADLRKERLDVDRSREHTAAGGTRGATDTANEAGRDAEQGAKSLGDKVDDLKDRVDGNPASKPGRDATDRPRRYR